VLHPARPGVDLGKLLLGGADGLARGVEQDGPGAGGALVQGQHVVPAMVRRPGLCASLQHLLGVGQDGPLQDPVEAHRGEGRAHPRHRRVQPGEALLADLGGHLAAEAAEHLVLVHHQGPVGLAHAGEDGLGVQGAEAAQVHHLDAHPFGLQLARGVQGEMHRGAVGQHGQPLSLPADPGPAEGDRELGRAEGLGLGGVVQELGFQEQVHPAGAQAGAQQPGGIVGEGRHHHPDAGYAGEPALDVLAVVQPPADVAAAGQADGDVGEYCPRVLQYSWESSISSSAAGQK